MSTFQLIQAQACQLEAGQLLAATDCLSMGTRAAIDQALYRMVKSGQLVRVSRGLYALERPANAQELAAALADKKGGLSARRTSSPRKMALAKTAHGRVLLDLWARGEQALTRKEIKAATADWRPQDLDAYLSLLPAWLRVALLQCHAKAKSVQLGLAGAYSWSNPQPRDELLIAKVLEQHRFEDMVRVCAHFGMPKVRRVFRQLVYEPMPRACVSRMLGNIAKGLKLAVSFKINSGQDLDRHIQDYAIDGVKVTFHARQAPERPRAQIEYLIDSPKHELTPCGFSVMGLGGLFVMKTLVVYDRVKSRDLYDLMVLTRDHGYTLKDAFAAITAYQPARHQDPEHFKSVLTGVIPLDADDEGFASIQLQVKMKEIYQYFKKWVNGYEVQAVCDFLQSKQNSR